MVLNAAGTSLRVESAAGPGAETTTPLFLPEPPRRLEELGIHESLVTDLSLRHINQRGACTMQSLAGLMKVPLEIGEAVFRRLNEEQWVEVRRMHGEDYVFALSPNGRKVAAERFATSRYTGPVPVSLREYGAAVRAQKTNKVVTPEMLRSAFADLVVPDALIDALGPALVSEGAIFLYGPSGTGKTSVAERLVRAFPDPVFIPRAVEVEGQIISIWDPATHESADVELPETDPRWVLCRRPFVAAGGELVTSMLDLQWDANTSSWIAPLQLKAANGILLIDDFGRQLMSPRDLLNRWIVPLDRKVDFLSLGGGIKFDVPFETRVVFSTNLAPKELADEAFLRRIPNKILVDSVAPQLFDAIFRLCAEGMGIACDAGSAPALRTLCLNHSPDLRPCFPRDVCSALRSIALFESRKPEASATELARAVTAYFV